MQIYGAIISHNYPRAHQQNFHGPLDMPFSYILGFSMLPNNNFTNHKPEGPHL